MKTNVSVNAINRLNVPELIRTQGRLVNTDGISLFI